MKKKKMAIVSICLCAGIYLIGYFLFWGRTNPVSYYGEKAKGNYNVIRDLHISESGDSSMLVKQKKDTYYFDYDKKELKVFNSKRNKIQGIWEDVGIYSNDKYMYVNAGDRLLQYDQNGKLLEERLVYTDGKILQMYLGEKYVYIICGQDSQETYNQMLYILDATNIQKNIDLGELKEQSGTGAFIDYEKHWVKHHMITTPDMDLYYIGNCKREKAKDAKVGYRLLLRDADSSEFFNPVMVSKVTKERVRRQHEDIYQGKLLASWKDTLYAWDYQDESDEFCVYKTEADGKVEELYHSRKYNPVEMRVSGNILLILLESYPFGGMEHYAGADYEVARYRGGELLCYDMEKQKILSKHTIKKEQAVWMDKEEYATFKNGNVYYYKMGKDKPVWRKKITGYKTGKGDQVIRYDFQTCGKELYVVCVDNGENEGIQLMDVIKMEE